MTFSFRPLSDEEIERARQPVLLSEGIHSFTVKNVKQSVSKTGNPMLEVAISILNGPHDERVLTDYLVSTDKMMFKIKHFCEAINLGEAYKKGNFAIYDCINRTGKVKIGIEKGKPRPDGSGFYFDRNKVEDYIPMDNKPLEDSFNDDIKF